MKSGWTTVTIVEVGYSRGWVWRSWADAAIVYLIPIAIILWGAVAAELFLRTGR